MSSRLFGSFITTSYDYFLPYLDVSTYLTVLTEAYDVRNYSFSLGRLTLSVKVPDIIPLALVVANKLSSILLSVSKSPPEYSLRTGDVTL